MENLENREKLEACMQDDVFVAKLMRAEGEDAVRSLFGERGIALTAEQLALLMRVSRSGNLGEMTEEELEAVAGGAGHTGDVVHAIMRRRVRAGQSGTGVTTAINV